ncbi:MAG: hypothetical protein ACPL1Z_05765 [Candidatus Bathyarchaeales archaeon]
MATLSLAIKGFPVGIPKKEIALALMAYGDIDTTVTVYCKRPDAVVVSQTVSVKPATYGKVDVVPVVIPDSQVMAGGAGNYEIWAQTTVDATTVSSQHHIVTVSSEIETLKFSLKDPDGRPTERARGAIILFHKKSGYFGVFATDTDGNVYVPRFAVNTDWTMEVHWRHPTDFRRFDAKIFDPVDFATVSRELRAEDWFTDKSFKMEIKMTREKFIDVLTIKNPILGRYAEATGSLVDNFTRVGALVVANELIGGLPYLDVVSAEYDSNKGLLTIYMRAYGILWLIALAMIVIWTTAITYFVTQAVIKYQEYEYKKTEQVEQTNKQTIDYLNKVREDLAAGRITESEAALLTSAPSELISHYVPSAIPSWVWAIVIIIVVLVICYAIVKIVPALVPKKRRR